MRKFMIATGAAALMAASSFGAMAFETRAVITSVDQSAGTVTIDNGATLQLPTGYDAADLNVGEQIMVDYDSDTNMINTFDVVTDGNVMEENRGDE